MIWQGSFSEFTFSEFVGAWEEVSSLLDVPSTKVWHDDTVEFLSSLSGQKELLVDEVERFFGDDLIKRHKISVDDHFGKLVKIRLETSNHL